MSTSAPEAPDASADGSAQAHKPPLVGVLQPTVLLVGFAFTVFELYIAVLGGALTPLVVRAAHVGFVLALIFLSIDWRGRRRVGPSADSRASPWPDIMLAAAAAATCAYAIANSERFLTVIVSFPSRATALDVGAAGLLLLLLLEAARRSTSLSFAVITVAVILYALFGNLLPPVISINPYTLAELLTQLYTSTVGFWGDITGVSAIEIGVLVLFAGVLTGAGGLDFLRNFSVVLAGRAVGGAGKVAVLMSAFFGMISGSSAANVASIGSFTIPMMKREGYRREFAAGLEAASSTFGQLMPPIMGTAAFIMAELLNLPYTRIMAAALLPSLAIYTAIYFATHFYASRDKIGALPDEVIAEARSKLTRPAALQLLGPLTVLITLIVLGWSVPTAAFWAYIATLAIFMFQRRHSPARETAGRLVDAMMAGVNGLIAVAVLIFAAQTLVTLINMTSLGLTFTTLVTGSALHPFVLVLLTALATLVLGMGMPTTAAYVIAVSVTVPLMTGFGFTALGSHMFVFFFAILSAITPPICVAVYVASAIAGAHWLKVAVECLRISLMKFVLPFAMLYEGALLLDGSVASIVLSFAVVIVLSIMLEALCFMCMFGPMSRIQALLASISCVALGAGLMWVDGDAGTRVAIGAAGALLAAAVALLNHRRHRSAPMRSGAVS